jgi:CheY-like chemotaxis protein
MNPLTAARPISAPGSLRGLNVLVVDDNEDARTLLRQILTDASAHVLDTSSVDGTLSCIESFAPDVLVSDLAMPGEDGYDLIRRIRDAGWTAERLPAIALSAYARDDDRRRAIQAGYQAHLSKPPDVSRLLHQISTLTSNRRR